MSWLDRFSTDRRHVEDLLAAGDFRTALEAIEGREGPEARAFAAEVGRRAAHHWLAEAEAACQRGDRDRMNGALAEAARYYRDDLGSVFREARRRIRARILELTTAPHWLVLLHASVDQRAAYFGEGEGAPSRYQAFANPRLVESVAGELGGRPTPSWIERLEVSRLESVRPALARFYPDKLAASVEEAPAEIVRAALHVANGRPDLAVVPLLEHPAASAIVSLELARVAYALGFPGTAMAALGDFAMLNGRHTKVRRLHTGVFMAQLALKCGDAHQAVSILHAVPLHEVGRRPVLLYARTLARIGELPHARRVLSDWIAENPDDDEARALLANLEDPTLDPDASLLSSE